MRGIGHWGRLQRGSVEERENLIGEHDPRTFLRGTEPAGQDRRTLRATKRRALLDRQELHALSLTKSVVVPNSELLLKY